MNITEEEYLEENENYAGYCVQCNKITSYGVEPDARDYLCEECSTRAVMGLEEALLSGHIFFVDSHE